MKIATWNINGIKARIDAATTWLEVGLARHRLPAGDQVRRRGRSPRRPSRSSAITSPYTGRRASTASRCSPSSRSTRSTPRLAGDERRRTGALSRGGGVGAVRRASRLLNIYLPNGNPVGTEKYRLQARLDGTAPRSGRTPARARGALDHCRRLQRHPDARRRLQPGRLDGGRAVPAARPARHSRRSSISA